MRSKQAESFFKQHPVTAWLIAFGILATIVSSIATYMLWQNMIVKEQVQQLENFKQLHLKESSANVQSQMLLKIKRISYFKQNGSLIEALTSGDQLQLRKLRLNILNNLRYAESVRITPYGKAAENLDDGTPLKFSEIQMIRRAERRDSIRPEAVNGEQGWRLKFVVPVAKSDDAPVAGTLLITTTLDTLLEAMADGLDDMGKFTFIQTFEGGEHNLGTRGSGSLSVSKRISIPETPWVIEYQPSRKLLTLTQTNWFIFLLISGMVWLVMLGAAFLASFMFGRKDERRLKAINKVRQQIEGQDSADPFAGGTHTDILDIEVSEEEDLLGLSSGEHENVSPQGNEIQESHQRERTTNAVPSHIFRAYDIRGLVETDITNDTARLIGQALGSEALDLGETSLIVGRDARTHSPILTEYLVRGILSTGCNVVNIGTVPTPLVYFATETLETTSSGVVVTASHNGPEFNGFKVVMQGRARTEEDITQVRLRIEHNNFRVGKGAESRNDDVIKNYIETIFADVALASDVSIVLDASNGVTGKLAPTLFEELGCNVTHINCDLDGTFPNHGPDPTKVENLTQLIDKVAEVGADFGVAFDGDGDRLVVVTSSGQIIWPDRLLMLFAKDVLSRNPGADVVYDVKCTRSINPVVTRFGGRPIMWKTGHAPMKAKMSEAGALLGGEYSGHIFIKERWFGFDDGMYVAARLAEIFSLAGESLDTLFEEFPELPQTREVLVPIAEDKKFKIIEALKESGDFKDAKITTLDGLRIDFPYGWGIVRASNTSANLTLRCEAQTEAELHDIKALLTRELRKIDQALLPQWQ